MKVSLKTIRFYCLLLVCLQSMPQAQAQSAFPIKEWVNQLDTEKISGFKTVNHIIQVVWKYDSLLVANTFSKMEERGKSLRKHFHFRMQFLRIWHTFFLAIPNQSPKTKPALEKLMQQAYQTGDKKLIAYASWANAKLLDINDNTELILTHKLKAVELFEGEEAAENLSRALIDIGDWLFHTTEYRQSIEHLNQGLKNFKETPEYSYQYTYKGIYNTIGQSYQQLGMTDSAMHYFLKSMRASQTSKDTVWQGINSLYIGQILFGKGDLEVAKTAFNIAYNTNKREEPSIAACALQWLGKTMMHQKKFDSAALYLGDALSTLKRCKPSTLVLQVKNFLKQIYKTKAELFQILNIKDSAIFYNALHINLTDSLQTVAASSNSKMSQLRINNEKSHYAFLAFQTEKEKEAQTRNFIIIIITLVAIIAIIILNRQRKVLKYKQDLNLAQKAALIAEAEAAREQLNLFTRNLLEKTELLENLQKQIGDKSASKEQQDWLTELTGQTILTEEDWTKFKALFERMYPGFFIKLKETFTDITGAEQRMAALSRLHITPTQIAEILGISVNSVHKTRQRLRLRLNLSAETTIKDFLLQL